MRRSKILLCLALATTLLNCTPDKRKDSGGDASFVVKTASGWANPGHIDDHSTWKVMTSVELGFEVCIQDRASRTDLRSQAFYVDAPGGGREIRTVDTGCLHWNETLPFNFFAGHSGWVTIDRHIVGRDVNQGTRLVQFAINPWAVGEKGRDAGSLSVVYLRDGKDGYIPNPVFPTATANQFLAGTHSSQDSSRLVIQDVKIRAIPQTETNTSVGSRYMIEMNPVVASQKANGDNAYGDVPDGDFDVKVQLLTNLGGDGPGQKATKVLVLDKAAVTTDGHMVHGTLRAELFVNQLSQADQGSMELAIRITPKAIGPNATIKPFNGLFALGLGTIAEDGGGPLFNKCDEKSNDCDFDKVVADTANIEALKKSGRVRDNERYDFKWVKSRFLAVEPGETATQRTVSYTASTCITDLYTGKPLAHSPVTIRYLHQDRSKVKPDTDDADDAEDDKSGLEEDNHDEIEPVPFTKNTEADGCLSWVGRVYHKYYKPEKYFERKVQLEMASGFKKTVTFYLNPWDTNVNFGFDFREMGADESYALLHKPKIRSRFFLGSFGYHTVRFLYNIDPFMELEVRKTVLMELNPQVLRYSGIKDARKMVEHLRDGIYLMKVGIQKSYLDPRDNSRWLLNNSPSLQVKQTDIGNEKLATKEFVTTNMALVRVVDGMIIYPIELTMRDLRLMRVRSNFMVELQTVDERLIQAYHVFKQQAIQDRKGSTEAERQNLEDQLKAFKKKIDGTLNWEDAIKNAQNLSPELKALNEDRRHRADLEASAAKLDLEAEAVNAQKKDNAALVQAHKDLEGKLKETQNNVKFYLDVLKQQLQNGGDIGQYLNSAGQNTGVPVALQKDSNINDNFELDENLLGKLKKVLNKNDFSQVQLPARDDIDLEIFVEGNAGLKKRSFVGPVIFLSNAYGDSVRATDNLDEVKCADAQHPKDVMQQTADELGADGYERCLQQNPAHPEVCDAQQDALPVNLSAQNNKYQSNPFFGSLSHLCFKDVDDLMKQEKDLTAINQDRLAAESLKYNFVNSFPFPMDYVSLTNEPLKKLDEKCFNGEWMSPQAAIDNSPYKKKSVKDCLVDTKENTIPAASLDRMVNPHIKNTQTEGEWSWDGWIKWIRGRDAKITKTTWNSDEYRNLFFERTPDTALAMCNLLANRIATELRTKKLSQADESTIHDGVAGLCMQDNGLIHDIKLRIDKTGGYTFLGGLNLNFNVGESFSMGTSYSYGAELSDFVGAVAGFGAASKVVGGFLLKPFSIKKGMSSSEGTSVSESTYLVSQNAKFEVDLMAYEKCAVVRLSDSAVASAPNWVNSSETMAAAGGALTVQQIENSRLADFNKEDTLNVFRHGLMVCEGDTRKQNTPRRVEEMYFYFTQHFTEGDMLDQADLYNHPWLLAMRGMRDFATFVNKIRAQDPVTMVNFGKSLIGWQDERKKAWALEHMSAVYADVLPSFPGYYTVLDQKEDLSAFLLQQSRKANKDAKDGKDKAAQDPFTKVDKDPLTGEDPELKGMPTQSQSPVSASSSSNGAGDGGGSIF